MTYAEIQAEKSVLRVEDNWCLAGKSLSLTNMRDLQRLGD